MTIIYHANKVQETSTTSGIGNFVLNGATSGYKTVLSGIGEGKRFSYYIYRQDTNFEWEIGIGYITFSGGVTQLIRERVLSSTNNNNLVGFTSGTKYIESIVGESSVNTSFLNIEEKSSNFTAPYSPTTYIIDASVTGVQVTLPGVASQVDPIIMGFLLDKTIGNVYEQPYAITLVPSGTETINSSSFETVTILKDYLQIVSVPSQTGWLLLDPIQDSTNPYGVDGTIQFKYDGSFSGVDNLSWNSNNKALLIGGTGNLVSADIILPASGQTVVFNEQSLDKDFRIEGSGTTHLFFIDASTNRVGINDSNPQDVLQINTNSSSGITIHQSGIGPRITIGNTTQSGLATNNTIGSIVFSGLNSANSSVTYGKLYCLVEDPTSTAELSSINLEIVNNGANEDVAVFSASGISLGFNNQNIDGIIIGNASDNEGNNICIGYYNSSCGNNVVVVGNDIAISSGTFGGAIGYDHAVSGSNVWVFGGSGVSVTGSNRVYLAMNNNNHVSIINSGSLAYTTLNNSDVTVQINNTAILSTGLKEQLSFNFVNSSGISRSGLLLGMDIVSPTNNLEKTRLFSDVISGASGIRVLSLDKDSLVIGNNAYSGNNIIYGLDNNITVSGNRVFGSNISGTGTNNNIFGNTILYSGNNTSIFGNTNTCGNSGNLGIVIFGNNNIANEDYATIVGHNNSASGLYSISCGYLNGTHGDYSVSVGEGNLVLSNGSIAIGNVNNLSGSSLDASIVAVGIGNTANISATGYIIGHNNQLYGSGSILIGNNCTVSGANNTVIGQNIDYSGSNTLLLAYSGLVSISGSSGSTIHNASLVAKNHSLSVTNTGINIIASGINISDANNVKINYGNSNIITLVPGTVHMSGLPVTINYTDNRLETTSSGSYVRNNNNYVRAHTNGIEINSSGSVSIVNENNYINLYPTGISIVATGQLDSIVYGDIVNNVNSGSDQTFVDGYKKFFISSSGATVLGYDAYFLTTYPLVEFKQYPWSGPSAYTEIKFYTNTNGSQFNNQLFAVMHSGRFGIGNAQPNHTIDITGDMRLNNTGSGIIYQNVPTATGYASPLVIEDDIIRSSSGGSIYLTPPTATGIPSPLVIEDNIIKLPGPSGISLPTNYEVATGLGLPLVSEDGTMKIAISGTYGGVVNQIIASGGPSSGILTANDAKIQFIDSGVPTYILELSHSGVPDGKEFFIRGGDDTHEIELRDELWSFGGLNKVCVLGGTGVLGSGNKSCHVVFQKNLTGYPPITSIWSLVGVSTK